MATVTVSFTVTATLQKTSGKFASKDAIGDEVRGALEEADPGSLSLDESEYDVTEWNVEGPE